MLHRARIRLQRAGARLVDVSSREQLGPFRPDIGHFKDPAFTPLLLNIQVPVLHGGGSQVPLKSQSRARKGQWEKTWKRIVQR
ncbi:MAG: hypothetical protein DMG05_27025 [Acidobacteria bacterium]|nr:MAG: hypothetical protein DMG05_27025 [Acidobacteriota bacterium]